MLGAADTLRLGFGRRAVAAALLAAMAVGTLATTVLAGPDDAATAVFGRASLGNRPVTVRPDCPDDPIIPPGPPECFDPDHDASANALDNIVPRTVVVSAGGTVTFVRGSGNHQATVYAPGTDVRALQAAVGPGGGFMTIDTPEFDRLAAGPAGTGWSSWTTPVLSEPGRYLVVCAFRPHLRDLNMYGWIEVK